MSLDSNSTLSDALDQYKDNLSYKADESTAKAKLFIQACDFLILMVPKRTRKGGADGVETEIDPNMIMKQLEKAESWLSPRITQPTTTNQTKIRTFDHGGFRG